MSDEIVIQPLQPSVWPWPDMEQLQAKLLQSMGIPRKYLDQGGAPTGLRSSDHIRWMGFYLRR